MADGQTGSEHATTDLAHRRTDLADERTRLAVLRTIVALDRTLAAWIRTAAALIALGFSISTFFLYMGRPADSGRLMPPRGVSLALIGVGIGTLLLATLEYRRLTKRLHERYAAYGPFDRPISVGVAIVVMGLGALAFVLVLLHQ